ncbi:similar to oocyte-specific linker histone H1oo (predicted) [Rattus norvegicus]|uniref:Histone H1.8 n=1 Tax=Rattus norvegicus TaxID=10116 RepID=A6IL05_RAT|nr:H1.8 linker histone [Rattus norvegicus]EDM02134.1 similar to oocyte-specific linker histone H1oo (predicted) [Rattus norvegicus]|eukprot:NP_001102821.1 H1 histone family, member O, oocyte-specific [Rattus norvegicus]
MAPGSVSSVSSSSSVPSSDTSPPGSCGLPGAVSPDPSCSRIQVGQRNPTMLRMVLEALKAREKRQGTSVVAIKVYIQHKYPTVGTTRFKYLLKQALETGMRRGLLTRPANSKAKGATGSFKLVPKPKKKRTCAPKARGGATGTKETGSKESGLRKKDQVGKAKTEKAAPNPGRKRKAYPCSAATLEKAPKNAKAVPREVREAPLKRDKAAGAPLTANIGQKVKHSGTGQEADAHGKTKDVCEKSKASASKVQNSVASLIKKEMAAIAHMETVVQGAKTVQKTKAPTPSQDVRHKAQPTTRVRKTKTPEDTKRPQLPPKTSSKAPSKKAEASS